MLRATDWQTASTASAVIAALLITAANASAAGSPLEHYRWTQRLLLAFFDAAGRERAAAWRQELATARCEMDERDLLAGWLEAGRQGRIGADDVTPEETAALRDALDVDETGFTVLLVGKDGGVKARYRVAPPLEEVFALIDGMPMRRAEASRRDGSCGRDGAGQSGGRAPGSARSATGARSPDSSGGNTP